jgi:alpha-tubulin suppressor-like RCC1 family protein
MKAKESLNTEKLFCKISGSGGYAVNAIDNKGRLWAWGGNQGLQFGNRNSNSSFSVSSPVKTLGSRNRFNEICYSSNGCIALDERGNAWVWGGYTAQYVTPILGDGGLGAKASPVRIYGNKTFCKIATAAFYFGAIDKNGKAWSWGYNGYGCLGDGTETSKSTPVAVYGNKTFCEISFSYQSSLAIDKNGKAWQWGYVNNDYFGDYNLTPVSVYGNKTFCKIFKAPSRSLAIDKNGKIWQWGMNSITYRQYYEEEAGFSNTPFSICTNKTFCKIADTYSASAAIDKNGQIWTWGSNALNGALGNAGEIGNTSTPISIKGQKKTFCEISTAGGSFIAVEKNGRVWGWGNNAYGVLGDKRFLSDLIPRKILGQRSFNVISANYNISAGIDATGKIYLWGTNAYESIEGCACLLGNGKTFGFQPSPTQIYGQTKTFCHISLGQQHSLAIDKNGKAWAWGTKYFGATGTGVEDFSNLSDYCSPVAVFGNKTFCKIAALRDNVFSSAAIDKNGKIWTWGQLFNGTNSTTPRSISQPVKTFCQISSGGGHFAAIDKNGQAWAWGFNGSGQIGDNTTVSKITPVAVYGNKTFCKIALSPYSSFAIDKNNDLWAWGSNYNSNGYLGINNSSNVNITTPIKVYGNIKFNEISCAGYYMYFSAIAYGLDQSGSIWKIDKTPIKINSENRFCKISVGGGLNNLHVLLTDENNVAWSFGSNQYGSLGNYNSFTPVRLYNI